MAQRELSLRGWGPQQAKFVCSLQACFRFVVCWERPGSRGLGAGSRQPQSWLCHQKLWGLGRVPQLAWDRFPPLKMS